MSESMEDVIDRQGEHIGKLTAELAAARAENRELKQALVAMCDVYSANRTEKLKVKAFRKHAAGDAPFSIDDVMKTFGKLATKAEVEPDSPGSVPR